jgi:hypothetical protein
MSRVLRLQMLILTSAGGISGLCQCCATFLHMAEGHVIRYLGLAELCKPTISRYKGCSPFRIRVLAAIRSGLPELWQMALRVSSGSKLLLSFPLTKAESGTQLNLRPQFCAF